MQHVDEAATGDIADLETCGRMLDGVEAMVLCHMAPNPSGYETPTLAVDVNVKGTANLYHAAVGRKLSRVVLISSTAVLLNGADTAVPGDGPYGYGNRREKMGLYALTKVFQESLARWNWETHHIPTAILRPSHIVYDGEMVTKYGKKVERYSPNLIDPRDIGLAVAKALDLKDLGLESFNIGQEGAKFDLSTAHNRLQWRPQYRFEALKKN
jgi:nucleoside-diphosphate-sugar epimerase